jgi:hypothetical protein
VKQRDFLSLELEVTQMSQKMVGKAVVAVVED